MSTTKRDRQFAMNYYVHRDRQTGQQQDWVETGDGADDLGVCDEDTVALSEQFAVYRREICEHFEAWVAGAALAVRMDAKLGDELLAKLRDLKGLH